MYFSLRGRAAAAASVDRGNSAYLAGRKSPVQVSGISTENLVQIDKICWNRSPQFLGSALNAACESNELNCGYLYMEIDEEWETNWFSLSPVPGVGVLIRRYIQGALAEFENVADSFSVSYLLIPSHEAVRCKVNIIEEMVHVSVELDTEDQEAQEFFFTAETTQLGKVWGDAFLKAFAIVKTASMSAHEVGSLKDDVSGTMFDPGEAGVELSYARRRQQRHDEFMLCFLLCSDDKLRSLGITGGLERSTVRSLCWMSYLHFFPPGAPTSSWSGLIRESRKQYDRRAEKLWSGRHDFDIGPATSQEASSEDDCGIATSPIKSAPGSIAPARSSSFDDGDSSSHHTRQQSRSIDLGQSTAPIVDLGGRGPSKSVDGGSPTATTSGSIERVMNFDLQQQIEKDVVRTHNKRAFFRHPTIRGMLNRILMVYALEHPKVSYKQGMNDLVAAVLFLLYRERMSLKEDASVVAIEQAAQNAHDENLDLLLDFDFIEHDTYTLLSLMMQRMDAVFCPANDLSPVGSPARQSWLQRAPNTGAWDILSRLQWIQNVRLRIEDEELPVHLLKHGIHPHMYLLPWIRLLFSREYCMEGLWLLWDAIFALSPVDFAFANYVSVAMIEDMRSDLISLSDMASILLYLQRPRVRSIFDALKMVKRARELWDQDHQK